MPSRPFAPGVRGWLCLALILAIGTASVDAAGRITGAFVRGHKLDLEVVSTPDAMRTGLMFRETLADSAGMLFAYEAPQPLTFWMKNTRLPLSIAFLTPEGVVLNIEDMAPFDEKTLHHSKGPAKFAIEVNQGLFQKWGVAPGDRVRFLKTVDSDVPAGGS